MKDSTRETLLCPDEVMLWSAQARVWSPKFARAVMFAMGCFVAVSGFFGIWVVHSGPGESTLYGYFGPPFIAFVGLSCVWIGITGRGLKPVPVYALSKYRAFVTKVRHDQLETTARFIAPNRAIQIVEGKERVTLYIPVKPESQDDDGFMAFEKITRREFEAAVAIINRTIGIPTQ